MTPTDIVLDRLRSHGCEPQPSGDSQWMARCPAHDDQRASLSIGVGENGGCVMRCHAGCFAQQVVEKIGLTLKDLMPSDNGRTTARKSNGRPRIVATYDYRDEAGELLYQVVRFDPKDFRQRRPAGNGKWTWSIKGVRRVLYRLPELVKADPKKTICIVEGEKDADRLAALNILATCNPGGAGKFTEGLVGSLKGRPVVILRDNDPAGRKHGEDVARKLYGRAASVKVVDLPGLPDKGDVSDWLDAGGTREGLAEIVEATPEWNPPATAATAMLPIIPPGTRVRAGDRGNIGTVVEDLGSTCLVHFVSPEGNHAQKELPRGELTTLDGQALAADAGGAEVIDYGLITGLDLLNRDCRIEYLVKRVLVKGQHTLLGGPIKCCKSLVAVDLACSLAGGAPWLGHEKFHVPRPVKTILMNGESGWPVLQEAVRRIAAAREVPDDLLAENLLVGTRLPKFGHPPYLDALRQTLAESKAEVCILDCAYRAIPGDQASNVFGMGELLDSIGRIFEELGTTLILLHHTPKHVPPGESLQLDNLAFAGFAEFAAGWLLLNRQTAYEAGSGHHELLLTVGARAGLSGNFSEHTPRTWQVEVGSGRQAREERQKQAAEERAARRAERDQQALDEARKAIVQAMVKLGRPADRAAIQDRVAIQRSRFVRGWASLLDDSTIVEAGTTRKGNNQTYPIYQVSDDSDA